MSPTLAEIRDHIRTWPTWQRDLWLGALVFVVVAPAWITLPPAARWWLVGVVCVASFVAVVTWALELRGERDSARATVRELNTETARLHLLLTELQIGRPHLSVVPPQCDGSEHEWPRIARAIGIENGENA